MWIHALLVALSCSSVFATSIRTQQRTNVGNIAEVATQNGFSSLVDFVVKAGLAETLSSGGPFTVFAPTNEAFAALHPDTVKTLSADPDLLKRVLLYHVVPSKILSSDLANDVVVASAEGTTLRVNLYPTRATVNGVDIKATDVEASNGVIHVIDKVLIPPSGDVVDVLAKNPMFSTLVTAVKAADLVSTLKSDGPFTVFAPTNAAFSRIPQADLQSLLQNPKALAGVLTRHVVPQTLYSAAISNPFTTRAVSNDDLSIMITPRSPAIRSQQGASNIIQTDIPATNGVIHVLDHVI